MTPILHARTALYSDAAADTMRAQRRIVLKDHVRLPGRFFGRLTATAQAAL